MLSSRLISRFPRLFSGLSGAFLFSLALSAVWTLADSGLIPMGSKVAAQDPTAPKPESEELRFFKNKVLPILRENCFRCHGAEAKIEGGLVLTERQGILDGGDSGEVVDLNDAQSGPLMEAIRYERKEMPPDGKLSDDEIQTLQNWIEQGLVFDGNFTFKR